MPIHLALAEMLRIIRPPPQLGLRDFKYRSSVALSKRWGTPATVRGLSAALAIFILTGCQVSPGAAAVGSAELADGGAVSGMEVGHCGQTPIKLVDSPMQATGPGASTLPALDLAANATDLYYAFTAVRPNGEYFGKVMRVPVAGGQSMVVADVAGRESSLLLTSTAVVFVQTSGDGTSVQIMRAPLEGGCRGRSDCRDWPEPSADSYWGRYDEHSRYDQPKPDSFSICLRNRTLLRTWHAPRKRCQFHVARQWLDS
jgi:hypothetical protein